MSIADTITEAPMVRYQRHLDNGELAYQHSLPADRPFFFPRAVCPYSGTDQFEWRISNGTGTIYALTVISPRGETPYAVVLVDVDEGFRMMSRVMDADGTAVSIGDRVRLSIRPGDETSEACPFFVLENGA